jgi:fatty-acyl-CoA synthase/long-chain acyl-CoA synthetase
MRKFDPEEALRLIEEKKITNTFMVPTMYNFILELAESKKMKYDLSSMRILISSGAPLPTRIKEQIIHLFDNAGLNEFYGATEFAYATYLKPKDQLKKRACAGKPFWGVEIKLLNENKKQVPVNTVGELFVKSPFMMAGYYKRGKEGFEREWFSVGDLAKQDEEGYFYIVDRKKDLIISGGVNIYPAEIEDVLYSNPKILEVAVIGVPDERWGESVKAIVVLREGETSSEFEIMDYCRDRMADYKIPKSVSLVESLPKSSSGKIMKRILREELWKGRDAKV